MVHSFNSPIFLVAISNFIAGNRARSEESTRPASFHMYSRQFQSYDAIMTAGHCKSQSSISTSQDSPVKSVVSGEGVLGYRESKRSGQIDLTSVWQNCLSAITEPQTTEIKRMYLRLLHELTLKGNLEITHLLFIPPTSTPSPQVTITLSTFLSSFSSSTSARIEALSSATTFARAVWDYTCSDLMQFEDLEGGGELAVISERLSAVGDFDEEEGEEAWEQRKHERTGTTIYHNRAESTPIYEKTLFRPCPLLESLIKMLGNTLNEELEDLEMAFVRVM